MNSTMRCGSGNGTGFKRTALNTEKMAVLRPTPMASAAMAVKVKPQRIFEVLQRALDHMGDFLSKHRRRTATEVPQSTGVILYGPAGPEREVGN